MAGGPQGLGRWVRFWTLGTVLLFAAVFSGWALGSALFVTESLEVETVSLSVMRAAEVTAREADLDTAQGPVRRTGTGRSRGAATAVPPTWRVSWRHGVNRLLPVREDYRLLRHVSQAKGRVYEIFEDEDHLRRIRVPGAKALPGQGGGASGSSPLVTMQFMDVQGRTVRGAAMLVDRRGIPWGPVEPASLRLPEGWRGYVLVRGYASAPAQIRAPGLMRITLHPEAEVRVTIASEGLSIVGSRLALRVYGANVDSDSGRWIKLEGRTQVRLQGLRRGGSIGVELHSELQQFDVARESVELEQAVNKLEIVARAYATARVHTSDPSLFGKTLYVAPFYAKDRDAGTLDFRYPWRAIEWDGSGWPLSRLREGTLDFWVWTEGGRFGSLAKRDFLTGSSGVVLAARLDAKASPTLLVSPHALLGNQDLEVTVFDTSYKGNPENLLGLRRAMPGLRLKTWTVQAGRTLRMDELWQRRSRVVMRSKEGATLWDGTLDLAKNPTAHMEVTLALGALVRRQQPAPRGQPPLGQPPRGQCPGWRVFSKRTGEVVRYEESEQDPQRPGARSRGLPKTLLLREGPYELRPLNAFGSTQAVQIVAGQIAQF